MPNTYIYSIPQQKSSPGYVVISTENLPLPEESPIQEEKTEARAGGAERWSASAEHWRYINRVRNVANVQLLLHLALYEYFDH